MVVYEDEAWRYRREVVEEILDIRVFGLMDLILRSQQSDLQKN